MNPKFITRNYNTHIKNKQILILLFITLVISSCDKKEKRDEVILAKVNDSILTESKLNSALGSKIERTKYREEFIRNWTETELLSQTSLELDLLSQGNYYGILERSKKELAANIAIQSYLMNQKLEIDEKSVQNYFNKNKDDYILLEDAYVINIASFKSETSAIKFRSSVIKEGWGPSVNFFSVDSSLLDLKMQSTLKRSQFKSKLITRALDKLFNGEVTLVLETELNDFAIVELIDKIPKNSIPKYKYVKENVLRSYQYYKRKEIARKYIDSLMTKKNVKIY